jgi:hypothetical protein
MYSFKQTQTGGVFKSARTRREYPYTNDPAQKNKRAAMAQLRADDKQYIDAAAARPKTPTPSHVDTVVNSTHQEKAARVQHLASTPRWANETPSDRLAALQRDRLGARTPADIAKIDRRIAAHQQSQAKGEAKAAVRQAAADARSSPDYIAALADADSIEMSLSMRSDIDDSYVQSIKAARLQLLQSANVEQFKGAVEAIQSRYQLEANTRIMAAQNTMSQMRADIRGIKADTLLPGGSADAQE